MSKVASKHSPSENILIHLTKFKHTGTWEDKETQASPWRGQSVGTGGGENIQTTEDIIIQKLTPPARHRDRKPTITDPICTTDGTHTTPPARGGEVMPISEDRTEGGGEVLLYEDGEVWRYFESRACGWSSD